MPEERRPRAATAAKRARLLDVAEQIMLEEGYAAVTSRHVADRAGIKLHYHFPTIDDLFVAVLRRRAERSLARLESALSSPEPLRAWWELASDPRGTALLVELTAAANHRPALKAELAELARQARRMQRDALGAVLEDYGVEPDLFPPALVAAAVQGLALTVVQDQTAGFETGHEAAAAAMAHLLAHLEERRARRTRRRAGPAGT